MLYANFTSKSEAMSGSESSAKLSRRLRGVSEYLYARITDAFSGLGTCLDICLDATFFGTSGLRQAVISTTPPVGTYATKGHLGHGWHAKPMAPHFQHWKTAT